MDNLDSLVTAHDSESDTASAKIAALHSQANNSVYTYLVAESEELKILDHWRKAVFNHPDGNKHFKDQQRNADKAKKQTAIFFYKLMKTIGQELAANTSAFKIHRTPGHNIRILDMCMAPGGFLETALNRLPKSTALAFTLPVAKGGHKVLLNWLVKGRVEERHVDITMLAEDMGVQSIPEDHAEGNSFLPRLLHPDQRFDLVICDGQVLRTHERLSYRENKEAMRLSTTQLALGLEHLRSGGTMIILLHGLDRYRTARLIWDFSKFSSIQIYKPQSKNAHLKKSSFYMVATSVDSSHPVALQCIEMWKLKWTTATFGQDEEYLRIYESELKDLDKMLDAFGPQLVKYGKDVWNTQAEALEGLLSHLDYKANKRLERKRLKEAGKADV